MIQSIQDAFNLIDQAQENIPFDAIEYLYDHPADPAITDKIVFAITHAFDDDTYFDEDEELFSVAPLCYMIVAENHVNEALIEPIIGLFSDEENSDFLIECEQGAFLVGKLCEAMPDIAVPRFLNAIEQFSKTDTEALYSYLFDTLYFADIEKYKPQMLHIFQEPALTDPNIFAQILVARNVQEALPIMEERLKLIEQELAENEELMSDEELEDLEIISDELHALLEEIAKGEIDFSAIAQPWVQQRPHWKEYLQAVEEEEFDFFDENEDDDDFFDDDDDEYLAAPDEINDPYADDYIDYENVQETVKPEHPKVGRNEPCPCGSGKKFKQCHWGKGGMIKKGNY